MSSISPDFKGLFLSISLRNLHQVEATLNCFYFQSLDAALTVAAPAAAPANANSVVRDINEKHSSGVTPLYLAVQMESLPIVEKLLQFGASPNVACRGGRTPLYLASVAKYNIPIAAALLRSGADPDLSTRSRAIAPLHVAVHEGRTQLIELLLDHGANADILSLHGAPLHLAARKNHCECARLLLAHAANVNVINGDGETPLMLAASAGHEKIANLLLQAGANVLIKDFASGDTALHNAVTNGHQPIAQILVQACPDLVHTRNAARETAAFGGSFRMIKTMRDSYSATSVTFLPPPALNRPVDAFSDLSVHGIAVHRIVVFSRCPELQRLCAIDDERNQLLIPPTVCAKKAVPFLIEFLYSDFVVALTRRNDNTLAAIATAATNLKLKRLHALCQLASQRAAAYNALTAHSALANAPSSFAQDMAKALRSGEYCDVSLVAGQGEQIRPIQVHKTILSAKSQFFRAMLAVSMRESVQNAVNVPISQEALQHVVYFLYTSVAELDTWSADLLVEVFSVAQMWMLPLLRPMEAFLVDNLDVDNVLALLTLSESPQTVYLHEMCVDFVAQNNKQFSQSDFEQLSSEQSKREVMDAIAFHEQADRGKQVKRKKIGAPDERQ